MKRLEFIRASLLALPFALSPLRSSAKETALNPSDIRRFNNDPSAAIKATGEAYFPPGQHQLNSLKITSGKLYGPGTITKAPQAMEAIIISGSVLIEELNFASADDRRDGCCEIRLGEGLERAVIQNCNFIGASYAAIAADKNAKSDKSLLYKKPAKNIKIINNDIAGAYSRHLYLHSTTDLLIAGNSFRRSKRDSIRLRQRCKHVQIINNNFEDIGTLPVLDKPESADVLDTYWSGEKLIFSNNIINGCALHAVDLKGIDTHNVIIANNQIIRCGWHGISLMGDSEKNIALKNIIIDSNTISECNLLKRDPDAAAIMLSGPLEEIIIKGNQLLKNNGRGLMVQNREDKKTINKNIVITSNIIHDSKIGILIFPCDGLILKDNITNKIVTHEKDRSYKMNRALIQDNLD